MNNRVQRRMFSDFEGRTPNGTLKVACWHPSNKGNDQPHELNAPFTINRFSSGELVDEHGAAAVAH